MTNHLSNFSNTAFIDRYWCTSEVQMTKNQHVTSTSLFNTTETLIFLQF